MPSLLSTVPKHTAYQHQDLLVSLPPLYPPAKDLSSSPPGFEAGLLQMGSSPCPVLFLTLTFFPEENVAISVFCHCSLELALYLQAAATASGIFWSQLIKMTMLCAVTSPLSPPVVSSAITTASHCYPTSWFCFTVSLRIKIPTPML